MKLLLIICSISLVSQIVFSQGSTGKLTQKIPVFIDADDHSRSGNHTKGADLPTTIANYMAVDTMHNTFGPASNGINPLVYDPNTFSLAVVHRGNARTYAVSSHELWWNTSYDFGNTWSRSTTSVQNGMTTQLSASYPSMTTFSPPNSIETWGCFVWPEYQAGNFLGGYGYTSDFQASSFTGIDSSYTSPGAPFSDDQYLYWIAGHNSFDGSIGLFRTQDFSVIEIINPPTWAPPRFNESIVLGTVAANGVLYFGIAASFSENIGLNGWTIGYSKSTDYGSTWSDWYVVDWTQIPLTSGYEEIWDWLKGDGFISYSGAIQVDKDGMVHFLCGLTDTIAGTENGYNAVVELYETSVGVWDAKILAEGSEVHDKSIYSAPDFSGSGVGDDPGIGQCGPSFQLAVNQGRDFLVAQWSIGSSETADTLCDIYYQTRAVNEDNWSSKVNITRTNTMNEDGAHLAPYLAQLYIGNSIDVYAFSMFWYEAGNTGPFIDPMNESVIYVAPVLVKTMPDAVEQTSGIANEFTLSQNYPNPFNPSTKINFTIKERGFVSLKIYGALGNEVASVLNKEMESGSYNVDFDGGNLPSGIYYYTLTSGDFSQTKKMLLLK